MAYLYPPHLDMAHLSQPLSPIWLLYTNPTAQYVSPIPTLQPKWLTRIYPITQLSSHIYTLQANMAHLYLAQAQCGSPLPTPTTQYGSHVPNPQPDTAGLCQAANPTAKLSSLIPTPQPTCLKRIYPTTYVHICNPTTKYLTCTYRTSNVAHLYLPRMAYTFKMFKLLTPSGRLNGRLNSRKSPFNP